MCSNHGPYSSVILLVVLDDQENVDRKQNKMNTPSCIIFLEQKEANEIFQDIEI